jgi:septum formation protein
VIILASRSPQRRALLGSLAVPFRVAVADIDEGSDPADNARRKAAAVIDRVGLPAGGAVLGCDTEVVRDGVVLGKPADPREARRMIAALGGRDHEVRSALALVHAGGLDERISVTRVWMRPIDEPLLAWYVATGEWRDRAGGYAIQGAGAALVTRIEGDHSGVVGLPLGALGDLLSARGMAPWSPGPPQ